MLSCCFLLLLIHSAEQAQSVGDLSPDIRPSRYDILLDTDFETWNYAGSMEVRFDVLKTAGVIKLHARTTVVITRLDIQDVGGNTLFSYKDTPGAGRQNAAKDLLVLEPPSPLAVGEYLMKCTFTGVVSKKLTGYYRTGYTEAYTGKYVKMASTHLSPDKARTVFPSFDEPQFRAVFSLTLNHPEVLTATSNMPVAESKSLGNGRKLTKFRDSPTMSTYLLAWVQHNFIYDEKIAEGVRMRHYARPSRRTIIQEKIDLLGEIVKFYNDYFKIPYPLPKLDTIGIPNYLVGGMENWGLITLSESQALSRPGGRFGSWEVSFRNLIAHEVSHMWFGNLVTMEWWNDLWLKEGMASYLSYPCVGAIYKDVSMDHQLMLRNWQKAMITDSRITSHAVRMEIKVTSQITQIFDAITYQKGATVLQMLREIMGDANFKLGMTDFLNTYKYSIAEYPNLVTSMAKFSGEMEPSLKHFMDTYILQKNYPLIDLEILSDTKIRLTQSRYVRDSGMEVEDDASPYNYQWYIPITLTTDSVSLIADKFVLMKEKVLELTLSQPFKWIKLNVNGLHMYVTNYPENITAALMGIVKGSLKNPDNGTFGPMERGHVILELFGAAQINKIPYSRALEAAKYLREELHYLPWLLTFKPLKQIRDMIDEDLADCFRQYVVYLLTTQIVQIRKEKSTLKEQLKFESFYKFAKYLSGRKEQSTVDQEELVAKLNKYKNSSPKERAEQNMNFETTSREQVELIGTTVVGNLSSDVSSIIQFIQYYSSRAPEAVWKVYRSHYKVYDNKYGLAQFTYADALKTMIKHQRDKNVIAEIEQFFKTHPARAGHLGVQNGLEEAKFIAKFKEESQPELRQYLENQSFCNKTK